MKYCLILFILYKKMSVYMLPLIFSMRPQAQAQAQRQAQATWTHKKG